METGLVWLLIFAGATIAMLGAFLVSSEKELKRKREEVKELSRKMSDVTLPGLIEDPSGKHSKLTKLEAKNHELQNEIAALNTKLAATECEFAESEGERRRFKNAHAEKRQLEVANQKLREEVADLKEQMRSTGRKEDLWTFQQEAAQEQIAGLIKELTAAITAVERSEARVRDLERDSGKGDSDDQTVKHEPDAELTARITKLERDLAESRIKLQAFDEVNRQLLTMEQRYEKLRHDNKQLEDQSVVWQRQYESSHAQHLHAVTNGFGVDVDHQVSTANRTDGLLRIPGAGMSEAVEVEETRVPSVLPANPQAIFGLLSASPSTGLDTSDNPTSLTTALAYLEAGQYEEALRESEFLMMETPVHREARLCHLLASVYVNSADGYETQIDAIKDMLDLSDIERAMAREIFLARAELAQKHGCDAEVLRYQNWAVCVGSDEPFGNDLPKTVGPADPINKVETRSAESSAVPAPLETSPVERKESQSGPLTLMPRARSIAAVVGLTCAVLLALFALFSGNGNDETALRSERTTPSTAIDGEGEKSNAQSIGRETNSVSDAGGASAPASLNSNTKAENRSESASVSGSYKIVKATAVFNEPSEQAALVASIEKGTQVNVIALRDGWFEIRSKHGRPPGFIRRETAIKIN